MPVLHPVPSGLTGPLLQATGLTKHYGGVLANTDIDFSVNRASCAASSVPTEPGSRRFSKC